MNRLQALVLISLMAGTGCASFVQSLNGTNDTNMTLKQIAASKAEAEADPQPDRIEKYAADVALFAHDNPKWKSDDDVQTMNRLMSACAANATEPKDKRDLEKVKAQIRLAARDVPGAQAIYSKLLRTEFDSMVLGEYLHLLQTYTKDAPIAGDCRKWYDERKSKDDRAAIVDTCAPLLTSKDSDGLDWLPAADLPAIREERLMVSAELQDVQGGIDRKKAREDGRLFTAAYRGPVPLEVKSACPKTTYLARSATPRGPLGEKVAIPGKTNLNSITVNSDNLLWLVDDNGRRIAVARIGTWNKGLLITEKCGSIIPIE
jgi:hypothetical protein